MSQHARVSHPIYSLLPTEIEGYGSLAELALDLGCSSRSLKGWEFAAFSTQSTRAKLASLGLQADEGVTHEIA